MSHRPWQALQEQLELLARGPTVTSWAAVLIDQLLANLARLKSIGALPLSAGEHYSHN